MYAHVLALLAVCAVIGVIHVTPVGSQCTTKHCYDDDIDSRVLTAISGLQDAVERQRLDYQDSLQQLQRAMEEQEKQLTKLNDCEYCIFGCNFMKLESYQRRHSVLHELVMDLLFHKQIRSICQNY